MSLFPEIGPGGGGAALETVAANIGHQVGIAGAGADGKGADAGHTHLNNYAIHNATYTITAFDCVVATVGGHTFTLPGASAAGIGRTVTIKSIGGGQVIVALTGGDSIDGSGIVGSNQAATFISDGISAWRLIGTTFLPTITAVALGGDVTVVTPGTYQTILTTGSLPPGTYLVNAVVQFALPASLGAHAEAKLRLLTAASDFASGELQNSAAAAESGQVDLPGIQVTLATADTIELMVTGSATTVTAKAALSNNGVGNNATQLSAVQLG